MGKKQRLTTAGEVIDALGGPSVVGRLFGVDRRNVHNWKARRLPPESFVALSRLLRKRGYEAPASLWGQYEIVSD